MPEQITLTKPNRREVTFYILFTISVWAAPWWVPVLWLVWLAWTWNWEIIIHIEPEKK